MNKKEIKDSEKEMKKVLPELKQAEKASIVPFSSEKSLKTILSGGDCYA